MYKLYKFVAVCAVAASFAIGAPRTGEASTPAAGLIDGKAGLVHDRPVVKVDSPYAYRPRARVVSRDRVRPRAGYRARPRGVYRAPRSRVVYRTRVVYRDRPVYRSYRRPYLRQAVAPVVAASVVYAPVVYEPEDYAPPVYSAPITSDLVPVYNAVPTVGVYSSYRVVRPAPRVYSSYRVVRPAPRVYSSYRGPGVYSSYVAPAPGVYSSYVAPAPYVAPVGVYYSYGVAVSPADPRLVGTSRRRALFHSQ